MDSKLYLMFRRSFLKIAYAIGFFKSFNAGFFDYLLTIRDRMKL